MDNTTLPRPEIQPVYCTMIVVEVCPELPFVSVMVAVTVRPVALAAA